MVVLFEILQEVCEAIETIVSLLLEFLKTVKQIRRLAFRKLLLVRKFVVNLPTDIDEDFVLL
jgi:hypothetical protein